MYAFKQKGISHLFPNVSTIIAIHKHGITLSSMGSCNMVSRIHVHCVCMISLICSSIIGLHRRFCFMMTDYYSTYSCPPLYVRHHTVGKIETYQTIISCIAKRTPKVLQWTQGTTRTQPKELNWIFKGFHKSLPMTS